MNLIHVRASVLLNDGSEVELRSGSIDKSNGLFHELTLQVDTLGEATRLSPGESDTVRKCMFRLINVHRADSNFLMLADYSSGSERGFGVGSFDYATIPVYIAR